MKQFTWYDIGETVKSTSHMHGVIFLDFKKLEIGKPTWP